MANLSNINNKFIVASDGKVGIGTTVLNAISGTNPTLTLGGTGISGGLILQKAGTDTARLYENAGNMVHQGMTGIGHHFYVNAATQAMVIDSSGNVGIGGTPSTFANFTNVTIQGGSSGSNLDFKNSSGTRVSAIVSTPSLLSIETNTTTPIIFKTNDTERMRIDSSGNINIGPDALDIQLKAASNNSGKNLIYLRGNASGDKAEISLNHYGYANMFIGMGTTANTVMSLTATSGGTDGIIINTSGNVGIGINDPDYPIDVNGVIRSKPRTQAANVSGKLILASDLNSVTQIGGIIGTISFTSDDSDAGADFEVGKIEVVNVNQYGLRNDMTFTTRDQNTVSEKMRIQWDGNVGIGTTSPSTLLNVNSLSGTTYPTLGTASGVIAISINELHGMYLGVDGSSGNGWIQAMREDATATAYNLILQPSGGNVGIGTTSPYAQLHVSHSLGNGGIMLGNTATTGNKEMLLNIHPLGLIWQRWVNGAYQANLMTLDYDGNLGIGTTSPDNKLQVVAGNGNVQAWFGESSYTRSALRVGGDNSPGGRLFFEYNGDDSYIDSYGGHGSTQRYRDLTIAARNIILTTGNTSGSEKMRITSGGNIGINYTGPFNQISGTETTLAISNSNVPSLYLNNSSTNGHNYILLSGTDGAFAIYDKTVGTNRMVITSGGSLLVGGQTSTVYTEKFSIENTTASQGMVINQTDNANANDKIIFQNTNGVVGYIRTTGSATSYVTSSDYRLKEDLQDFNGLDKVSKIPVYNFKWKTDESRSYGVMAHELQEVLPDAVSGDKDAEEMQGVDYSKIVPLLVKSIQELKAEIELLKSK